MEPAVIQDLEIAIDPEVLDEGSVEERATFGLFVIRTSRGALTEGFDFYLHGYRQGPLVSGYHAAEWFAWNWWRLRWEPRSASTDWELAHRMTSIGEGYVWPNIMIFSDGLRTTLVSKPSMRPDAKPFRYVGAFPIVIPSVLFEAAIDAYIPSIVGRLREYGLSQTNLDRLWRDLLEERADPTVADYRRVEALLGRDPDEVEDDAVERLLADAARLGEQTLDEVAAAHDKQLLSADAFEQLASERGYEASSQDVVKLLDPNLNIRVEPNLPAWRVGAEAAQALRAQERLSAKPIRNDLLARMAGTGDATISEIRGVDDLPLSFVLDENSGTSRVVLRSKWETGRRFDLARLIGDRLIAAGGSLHPATRAYTYRQKAQRSFAAELLSPFEVVDDMLAGDYSTERQEDVADYFEVSPMTINTLLKNHGRLERDGSEDFDFVAA